MWYVVFLLVITWLIYRYKKRNSIPKTTIPVQTGDSDWEEARRQKAKSLENLKPTKSTDLSAITHTIEIPKSGQKGKLAFLNSKSEPCSTEDSFRDYMKQQGWKVMRAELAFWQGMFCLSFWEEIFEGIDYPIKGNDIPYDLFRGEEFYSNREALINKKFDLIKRQKLQDFINNQIQKYRGCWTRLIYDNDQNLIDYFETDIVQSFLNRIDIVTFAEVVYRVAQNPNENRSGLPDFAIWNDQELKMVEVKRIRERVTEPQKVWIYWMLNKDISIEIVRVKGV